MPGGGALKFEMC